MKKSIHSLVGKISSVFCFLNLSLVTVVIGIILIISTKVMCDEVSNYTGEILRHLSYQFNNYLEYSQEKLMSVYRTGGFTGSFSSSAFTPQEMLNLDRRLNQTLQGTGLYDKLLSDILIIGKNGYIYNTQERSNLKSGYIFEEQNWYRKFISESSVSNTHICLLSTHACDYYSPYHGIKDDEVFSMGMIIANKSGEYVGSLLADFDISEVEQLLKLGNYEQNGDIYLLDTNGNIVCQSSTLNSSGTHLEIPDDKKMNIYSSTSGCYFATINKIFSLISYQTTEFGWKIVYVVPFRSLMDHNEPLFRFAVFIFGVFIGINIVASKWAAMSINKPVNRLKSNIQKVDFRDMCLETETYDYDELNTIAQKFSTLLQKLNDLINKDYRAQIQINKLRLYSLQSQLNPHFLMNTLQLLQTEIICGNVIKANSIVVSISRLLHYSLYNTSDEVPIADEIGYVKRYLGLMSLKYEDTLHVEYDLDPNCDNYLTPKMILQPVIENCFTHGFSNSIDNASINISSKLSETGITFQIKDNGEGMTDIQLQNLTREVQSIKNDRSSIGVSNVHQRIQLIYGKSYGLSVISSKGQGTTVIISIPLLKDSHDTSGDRR